MNNIFGLSSTTLALFLTLVTGGILFLIVVLGMSNPILLRMGLRNIVRRPSQSIIMIVGLVLSMIFITASFGLQDSFLHSITTERLQRMGNVDEAVTGTFTQTQYSQALSHIQQQANVEAVTGIYYAPYSTRILSTRTQLSQNNQFLYAVPPHFDQVYSALTDSQGRTIHFADLQPDEVYLSPTAAQDGNLHSGDQLQITRYGYNGTITVTVRDILSLDLAVTDGELEFNGAYPEVFLPLATLQQSFEQNYHQPVVPNIICLKNTGPGGMDDIGPNGSHSQAITHFLETYFHASPDTQGHFPTYFDTTFVHPLKPDIAQYQAFFSPVDNKADYIASPAARQFTVLLPVFTSLLVGAGMLLLVLLSLLLSAERRAELGMSRAIGLQRAHLVRIFLIEGCGYSLIAASVGLLLGIGAVALELSILSLVPIAGSYAGHIPLSPWVSWQSMLSSWCVGVLTTTVVIFVCATLISHANVVTAIRDLDDPPCERIPFASLLRALWKAPYDVSGQLIVETPAGRFSRQSSAAARLLKELFVCGPLCLALGGLLAWLSSRVSLDWLPTIGATLVIAGFGLFANWIAPQLRVPRSLSRRLSFSLIGIGWLLYGIQAGQALFLPLFVSNLSSQASRFIPSSPLESLLGLVVPLAGVVMLVMSNADLLVNLLSLLLRWIRGLAPVSRISLVYPLTFRLRTGVTITLLGLITFLTMLVVINNLSTIQQSQVQVTTGNFQIEINGIQLDGVQQASNQRLANQLLATPRTLPQDVAAATVMYFAYNPHEAQPIRLLLPGNPAYPADYGATVADNTFLTDTTMPMYAHAQGFPSDRQVWDAVRDHPGYAVLKYRQNVGLPTSNGFVPFTAEFPLNNSAHPPYRRVTIIGITTGDSYWQTLFLSRQAETSLGAQLYTRFPFYYFRTQPGVSVTRARMDISRTFHLGTLGVDLNSLVQNDLNAYTASLTLFLAGYLAMGLIFGAFSIGVIASRTVVERRQQIGMLRAMGFSRRLVRMSFLLESSFVITLSLVIGAGLAWWLAYQITHLFSQDFPIPIVPVILLLLGSYLVSFLCTVLPARRASRVPPAEALRYE